PAVALLIPGAAHIIAAPIIPSVENDNGNSETGKSDVRQRRHFTAILEAEIFAEDPTAIAVPADVTPGFVLKTTLDIDWSAFGDDTDTRELGIRPRAHIHIGG